MKTVPHGTSAKSFIDWVNFNTRDEATRCRILLAEVLLRLEKMETTSKTIIIGYETDNRNGLFESERYKNMKIKPILEKIKPQVTGKKI